MTMVTSNQSVPKSPLSFREIVRIIEDDDIAKLSTCLDDGSIADVNMKSGDNYCHSTLLIMASCHGNINSVRLLLKYGATVNDLNDDNITAIDYACHAGHLDVIKLLHNEGANLDSQLLLWETCESGELEAVEFLLDHGVGVKINLEIEHCGTPLAQACKERNLEIIELLVEHGADVNFVGRFVLSNPLAAACSVGDLDLVKYLVSVGADARIGAPLASIEGNNVELINYLLDNGADIDAFDRESNPLLQAADYDLVENVRVLLERGANANIQEISEGKVTPLILACAKRSRNPIIKSLLDHGADTNAVDSEGDSALIRLLKTSTPATAEGDLECVRLLLEYGADVIWANQAGQTASSLVEKGSAIGTLVDELLASKPFLK